MSTVTARAIRRRNPNRTGRPTLMAFANFLQARGIEHGFAGRLFGARVLTASGAFGPFLSATFRHPTKTASRTVVRRNASGVVTFKRVPTGRFGSISWRKPETA